MKMSLEEYLNLPKDHSIPLKLGERFLPERFRSVQNTCGVEPGDRVIYLEVSNIEEGKINIELKYEYLKE